MNPDMIRKEFLSKRSKLYDEINHFIENAVNYVDYDFISEPYSREEYNDTVKLEWNDAKDQRYFDILNHKIWVVENIISMIDEINDVNGEKKKQHIAKGAIESLDTGIRLIKEESNELIEREQQMVNDVDSALGFLDVIRDKCS